MLHDNMEASADTPDMDQDVDGVDLIKKMMKDRDESKNNVNQSLLGAPGVIQSLSKLPKGVVRIAGEDQVSQVAISHDSKYVFCCCDDLIRIFAVATAAILRDLAGHEDRVTAVCLDPKNRFQIYSTSLDNSVILWDYEDGIRLARFHLSAPNLRHISPFTNGILRVFFPNEDDVCLLVISSRKERTENKTSLKSSERKPCENGAFLLRGKLPKIQDSQIVMTHCATKDRAELNPLCFSSSLVDFGNKGRLAVGVGLRKNKHLLVYDMTNEKLQVHINKNDKIFCLAAHPKLPIVAAGITKGKLMIFKNVTDAAVIRVVHHWHSLVVKALAFTMDGNYLLSGGSERVLVRMPMDHPEDRKYIPRLGADIVGINVAPSNDTWLLAMADNTFRVFESTMQLKQTIQGIIRCSTGKESTALSRKAKMKISIPLSTRMSSVPSGLHYDPKTSCLVLGGTEGHIQFFQPDQQNRHVQSLDILGLNFVSSRNNLEASAQVDIIALDDHGKWLITVEQWRNTEISHQLRIKIWQFESEAKQFSLHTVLNKPHVGEVTRVKFKGLNDDSPDDVFATCGVDGRVKLWSLEEEEDVLLGKQTNWVNDAVADYQRQIPNDLDFSEDGSVLAVAFGKSLTLWTAEFCQLKDTHSNPDLEDQSDIRALVFGAREASHLLVYATGKALICYNVLTLAVLWFQDIFVVQLLRDPRSSTIAIFDSKDTAFIFRPHTSQLEEIVETGVKGVISAIFIPSLPNKNVKKLGWQRKSRLLFMNEEQKLFELKEQYEPEDSKMEDSQKEDSEPSQVRVAKSTERTMFANLMAQEAITDVTAAPVNITIAATSTSPCRTFCDVVLSQPAHALPPVDFLCRQMHAMVLKKTPVEDEKTNACEKDEKEIVNEQLQKSSDNVEEKAQKEDATTIVPEIDFSWLSQGVRPNRGQPRDEIQSPQVL